MTLEPGSVRAGDVYLGNEGPWSGYMLVSKMSDPDDQPEGLSQEQVEAIAEAASCR